MVYVISRICRGIRLAINVMGGRTLRICMIGSTPAHIISAALHTPTLETTIKGGGVQAKYNEGSAMC